MHFSKRPGWRWGLSLAPLLIGCGDDVGVDDVATGTGGSGATGGSGGDGASGGGEASPLEACLAEQTVITVDCASAALGHVEWVGAGAGKCIGSSNVDDDVARAFFSLDDVDPDGNPYILGITIEPADGDAPQNGSRVAFSAPEPVLVTADVPLPVELAWPAVIEPMLFAGGLSFVRGETDDAEIVFEIPPTQADLVAGGVVRGTFHLRGGTYTILDAGGALEPVADPAGEVIGCFHLPLELVPTELER